MPASGPRAGPQWPAAVDSFLSTAMTCIGCQISVSGNTTSPFSVVFCAHMMQPRYLTRRRTAGEVPLCREALPAGAPAASTLQACCAMVMRLQAYDQVTIRSCVSSSPLLEVCLIASKRHEVCCAHNGAVLRDIAAPAAAVATVYAEPR